MPSPQGTKIVQGVSQRHQKFEKQPASDCKSLSATLRPVEKQPLLDSASRRSVQGKRNKATELEKPKQLKTKIKVETAW